MNFAEAQIRGPSYFAITSVRSAVVVGKAEWDTGTRKPCAQEDVRIAIARSHALLEDTAQLFDALDARANFDPIMQSVRDLNKLDD